MIQGESRRMSMDRQNTSSMVAHVFARGGAIQRFPEASPLTAKEVLDYLRSQRVEIATGESSDGKYTCNGEVLNLQGLIRMANRRRRKQRRPTFEISSMPRRHVPNHCAPHPTLPD